ncbi:MAG: hypothetical protein II258_04005 [Spirochaetales bacterium]|nr:hypothetical protein [Spirochaetales bacterium]
MTKKILSVLAMMSIAAMMMLSSCTAAGVECGLIGKWEHSEDGFTTTVEITADDKIIVTVKYEVAGEKKESKSEGTIKSVSDHVATYEVDGKEYKMEYSDLGCDTVKFGDIEYKKVY